MSRLPSAEQMLAAADAPGLLCLSLAESARDAIISADHEGRITFWNSAAALLFGYTAGEMLGQPLEVIMPERHRPAHRAGLARLSAIGIPHVDGRAVELQGLRRDGTEFPIELSLSAWQSPGGLCFGGIIRDITVRERAHEALRSSERQYRLLMEHAFDGIFLGDAEARCLDVNPRLCEMLGYTREELLGLGYGDLVLPEDLAERPLRFPELRAHRRLVTERRLGRKDGVVLHAEVGVTMVEDSHILITVRDITGRRRAEAAVGESEARFRSAFDFSGIGMALVALDGRWLRVNRALCRIVGYSEGEMLGLTFQDLTDPRDLDADLGNVRQLLAGEIDTYTMEKRYLHRDGGLVWVLLTVSLIRGPDGSPLHFIAQIQDVSARRQAEAMRERLTAVLELTPDVVAISTPDGVLQYLNRAGRQLLGFDDAAADAVRAGVFRVEDVQPQFARGGAQEKAVQTALREGVWRGETTLSKRDGRELPVEQTLLAHRNAGGTVEYVSAIIRDITERKQTETTLRALSLVDELTGLYNRRGFMALAEQEWRRAEREGHPMLLLYLDVDEFKGINDHFGHAEGDAALRVVATVLQDTFREADVLGRLGGDEFTALALHGATGTEGAIIERFERYLAQHNASATRLYTLAISIGVARATPGGGKSLAALMVEADAALYERKRSRKAGHG